MTQLKTAELLTSISDNIAENRNITVTGLANFFLIHEHLVTRFYLHEGKIYCNNEIVSETSNILASLSINLEKYFGNKDIYYGVLLKALKRYLLKKQLIDQEKTESVVTYAEVYLKNYITRKRTRVPLTELRQAFPDMSPKQIKADMLASGKFKVLVAGAGVVYFTKND